jgi:O-antigen/teichoic acid export membrane protein
LILIGIVLALQWPASFYEGALTGFQQLVSYNWLQSILSIVRSVGAALILKFVSPTIFAFFIWQAVVSMIRAIVSVPLLWHYIPRGLPPRFDKSTLLGLRNFAAGVTVIAALGIALMQADKVVLSNRLPLASFGYYNLAFVVGFSLNYLIYPTAFTAFGRLSHCVALGNETALRRTYHASCQLVTVLAAPAAFVIAIFSRDVMRCWTGSEVTASNTATIVSIAVIGTLLAGFVHVPYVLQIAHGWTRLALITNGVSLMIQVPMLILMASRYGAVGAASVWLAMNCANFFGTVNVMYTRILREERWRWYIHDIGLPAAAALLVVVIGRLVLPEEPRILMTFELVAMTGLAFMAAAAAAPEGRNALRQLRSAIRRGER